MAAPLAKSLACDNRGLKLAKIAHVEAKAARPPLGRMAFDRIKRDLITCELEPGRQVTEAELAARYALRGRSLPAY